MNVFAKFDEIQSMFLEVIKETKTLQTLRTHGRSDNVKTVYSPTNTVCGGISTPSSFELQHEKICLCGFRPGPTQTRLYSHKDKRLEIADL